MALKKNISRKKNVNIAWITALILLTIALLGASAYFFLDYSLNKRVSPDREIIFTAPKGSSISEAISQAGKVGALRPRWLFSFAGQVYSRFSGKPLLAGEYRIPRGAPNKEIFKTLFTGKYLYTGRVTFPEGITLKRFASLLKQKSIVDSAEFMRWARKDSLLRARGITARTAEGYLMPSTYRFAEHSSPRRTLDFLLDEQEKVWQELISKAGAQTMTKHEILTLASIVEAETSVPEERPRVAGVYLNRLRRGWLLQADPTVQYALGEDKSRVLLRDLEIDSPYNTYKYKGLPPGPINSPSKSSILAALAPETNDYLYFVAVGDGSGRHNFARTAAEHSNYVRIFRRNRNANN